MVPIMAVAGENKGALILRKHMEIAGVTHPRLLESSATRMPVGFRSWRDTGITWAAIDGVDLHKLQRRAGHDDVNTTLAYMKEAEDRAKLRGRVFPALPNSMVWPSVRPSDSGKQVPYCAGGGSRTGNDSEHFYDEAENKRGTASDNGTAAALGDGKVSDSDSLSSVAHEDLTEALDLATALAAMTTGGARRTAERLVRLFDRALGEGGAVIDLDARRRR